MPRNRKTPAILAGASIAMLVASACSSGTSSTSAKTTQPTTTGSQLATAGSQSAPAGASSASSDWNKVLADAKGQTVNWYMWGGSDPLNTYVTGYVQTQAAKFGVKVNEVKITDTVDAVNKVLGEKQAGKKDGSVDLIWINGENFATGKQANLWYCGWAKELPNAQYVDWTSPEVNEDFGTPVDDCEAPWSQDMSVVVYNSAKASAADFASVSSLIAWAKAHPGQFTYPAPPDFTGSMTVRRFFYDAAGGYSSLLGPFDQAKFNTVAPKAWAMLNDLKPSLWRKGTTYPQSSDDLQKLFGDGEISAYLSYDAGGVGALVDKGTYPASTRETVFSDGMIGNVNYVSIPFNSPHKAAAEVVANILESPEAELEKAKPDVVGSYPAIQMDKTPLAAQYAALPVPQSELPFTDQRKNANPELQAAWITAIENGWKANVLQK